VGSARSRSPWTRRASLSRSERTCAGSVTGSVNRQKATVRSPSAISTLVVRCQRGAPLPARAHLPVRESAARQAGRPCARIGFLAHRQTDAAVGEGIVGASQAMGEKATFADPCAAMKASSPARLRR
jgi:hypothetical protein